MERGPLYVRMSPTSLPQVWRDGGKNRLWGSFCHKKSLTFFLHSASPIFKNSLKHLLDLLKKSFNLSWLEKLNAIFDISKHILVHFNQR